MPIVEIQNKRLLFIHVPKTGGSAIERLFSEHGTVAFERSDDRALDTPCIPRHYHGEPLSRLFSQEMFDYVFMVVRDPVDRIISDYRYYVKRKKREKRPPNFSFWLRYRLWRARRNPWYMDNHFRPQHEFECLDATVFRYEDGLDECIATVASEVGLEIPSTLPKVNASPPIPVSPTTGDLEMIRRGFEGDIERFSY